jgi:D-threonate/D-erythronate kinase
MRLLVIADDFTGALDTGVQFTQIGIPTRVTANMNFDFQSLDPHVQVLVVDTQTRHSPGEEAYKRVRIVVERARRQSPSPVYKKTDSTLRGPFGYELKAVMDAWDGGPIFFIPAYPEMGRTTEDGIHKVKGRPLHQTAYGQDHLNPVQTSSMVQMLAEQGVPCRQTTPATLSECLKNPLKNRVYCIDAKNQGDLESIASQLAEAHRFQLTAGCAGFASVCARYLPGERSITPMDSCRFTRTLVLCGSTNEVSLQQMERLRRRNRARSFVLTREQKNGDYWESEAGKADLDAMNQSLSNRELLLIQSTKQPGAIDETLDAKEVALGFGVLTRCLLDRDPHMNLVVCGGDTAAAIMEAIGGLHLEPLKELHPGVVASRLTRQNDELRMITKAGGLGHLSALVDAYNFLKK